MVRFWIRMDWSCDWEAWGLRCVKDDLSIFGCQLEGLSCHLPFTEMEVGEEGSGRDQLGVAKTRFLLDSLDVERGYLDVQWPYLMLSLHKLLSHISSV